MPMLRQPHDHHRDFRTRLRAEVPAHAPFVGGASWLCTDLCDGPGTATPPYWRFKGLTEGTPAGRLPQIRKIRSPLATDVGLFPCETRAKLRRSRRGATSRAPKKVERKGMQTGGTQTVQAKWTARPATPPPTEGKQRQVTRSSLSRRDLPRRGEDLRSSPFAPFCAFTPVRSLVGRSRHCMPGRTGCPFADEP
jgi:hypothetical protein